MTERIPQSGEIYRHFKDKLYQVIAVAKHSETGEMLVIYQALYGDFAVYARPLAMFASEVDHEKYPQVTQRYRFEKVEREALAKPEMQSRQERTAFSQTVETAQPGISIELQSSIGKVTAGYEMENGEKESASDVSCAENEGGVNPKLMEFLDTDDFEEKYNILVSMRDCITDRLINDMAVVLDVVIPEGDLDDRYEALKNCVRTRQRYETNRLR